MTSTQTPDSLTHIWHKAGSQDGLDGVPLEVLNTLQRLQDADRPGSLCVLRLNEYRLLEESFGRHIGQELLKLVGSRLQAGLRGNDLLEQISEEEFVLILGLDSLRNMLSGVVLKRSMEAYGLPSMPRYWDSAPAIASAAMEVARRVTRIPPDEAYTLGLFCDVGIPLVSAYCCH